MTDLQNTVLLSQTTIDSLTESAVSSDSENDEVLFVTAKPEVKPIKIGNWKNSKFESSGVTITETEESGNEDPIKKSFASIGPLKKFKFLFRRFSELYIIFIIIISKNQFSNFINFFIN